MDICRHEHCVKPSQCCERKVVPFSRRVGGTTLVSKRFRAEFGSLLLQKHPPVIMVEDSGHFAASPFADFVETRFTLTIDANAFLKPSKCVDLWPLFKQMRKGQRRGKKSQRDGGSVEQGDQQEEDLGFRDEGNGKQPNKGRQPSGGMQVQFRALAPLNVFSCLYCNDIYDARYYVLVFCSGPIHPIGRSHYPKVLWKDPSREAREGIAQELQQLVEMANEDNPGATSLESGDIENVILEWPKQPWPQGSEESERSDGPKSVRVTIVPSASAQSLSLASLGLVRGQSGSKDEVEFLCQPHGPKLYHALITPERERCHHEFCTSTLDYHHALYTDISNHHHADRISRVKGSSSHGIVSRDGIYYWERIPDGSTIRTWTGSQYEEVKPGFALDSNVRVVWGRYVM